MLGKGKTAEGREILGRERASGRGTLEWIHSVLPGPIRLDSMFKSAIFVGRRSNSPSFFPPSVEILQLTK